MPFVETPPNDLGCPIPANTPHAVSVTLPTWAANIGYEEGEAWVMDKMNSGYPRFYIHGSIQKLSKWVEEAYGREGEQCLILSSYEAAKRCRKFIEKFKTESNIHVRIVKAAVTDKVQLSFVFFPADQFPVAKKYWQHTGEGISSRLAEYALSVFQEDSKDSNNAKDTVNSKEDEKEEQNTFVEERFGRNLDVSLANEAKETLRRRISDKLKLDSGSEIVSQDDVYLYPTGMTSIFSSHRALLAVRGDLKSVSFGFPYVDSLQIQKKFGAGVHFYGQGSDEELDQIEKLLEGGEQILMLFCEFPSNPLLKSPNLVRIRELADKYEFPVVVDETVGNFANVNVLPFSDIVVSSLTKVFSGDSNVMGGSLVLNPSGKFYNQLKTTLKDQFEDVFWCEDAIYMERNSRDVSDRSHRINTNAEAVADLFRSCKQVKDVFYPKYNPSKPNYDACKRADGGYGGLLSVVFHDSKDSATFYDAVISAKGPSLGTNFTLTSPYAILAHYYELDYVEQFGVERHLIRISVGLEEQTELLKRFQVGIDALNA